MKIILAIPYIRNESAGTTYATVELCSALQRNGCDVTLYTLNPIIEREYSFRIKSYDMSWYAFPALANSNRMYKELLVDAEDADILHAHMLWMAPSYYIGQIANRLNKPLVYTPHGALTRWALNRSKWKKNIVMFLGQKEALKATSCFHVTSELEKKELELLNYNKPIAKISIGIDTKNTSYTINKKYKRLIFMSRLHPVKGIDDLLKAWNIIQDSFNDWELIVIGGGDISSTSNYPEKMQALSKELKNKRVVFTGALFGEEKEKYLSSADIFILPTHSENFGMVVAEALAIGIPAICTKGAPWSGLIDKNAGWWVDIGFKSLVDVLKIALDTDDKILKEMGQNGKKWMKNDFSWDKIAQDMVKTYQWLLDKENKPNFIK